MIIYLILVKFVCTYLVLDIAFDEMSITYLQRVVLYLCCHHTSAIIGQIMDHFCANSSVEDFKAIVQSGAL